MKLNDSFLRCRYFLDPFVKGNQQKVKYKAEIPQVTMIQLIQNSRNYDNRIRLDEVKLTIKNVPMELVKSNDRPKGKESLTINVNINDFLLYYSSMLQLNMS